MLKLVDTVTMRALELPEDQRSAFVDREMVGRAHRCVAVNTAPAVNTAVNATPPPAVNKAERALRAAGLHAQLYEAPAMGEVKSQDDIWEPAC